MLLACRCWVGHLKPEDSQALQEVYTAIQAAHAAAVTALVDGAPLSAAYAAAQKALQVSGNGSGARHAAAQLLR